MKRKEMELFTARDALEWKPGRFDGITAPLEDIYYARRKVRRLYRGMGGRGLRFEWAILVTSIARAMDDQPGTWLTSGDVPPGLWPRLRHALWMRLVALARRLKALNEPVLDEIERRADELE